MDHKAIMQGVMVRIAVCVCGLATLAMLLLALYNEQGYFAVHARSLKLQAIQNETQEIEKEIKSLREENLALDEADPTAIEKLGREELDMVRPGERIINLSEEPVDDSVPANNE